MCTYERKKKNTPFVSLYVSCKKKSFKISVIFFNVILIILFYLLLFQNIPFVPFIKLFDDDCIIIHKLLLLFLNGGSIIAGSSCDCIFLTSYSYLTY